MLNVGAVVGMAGKQETAIPRKTDSARRNSSPHWWEDVEGWSSCLLEGPVTFNFHCGMCGRDADFPSFQEKLGIHNFNSNFYMTSANFKMWQLIQKRDKCYAG